MLIGKYAAFCACKIKSENLRKLKNGEETSLRGQLVNASFPHSDGVFSDVKQSGEKFHKKTRFCGLTAIDNNILLWYDCRAFFGRDDKFRPELP